MTKDEFIKKAKAKHGDKYDYSLVEYVKSNIKVIIICPEHGEFLQLPNSHLVGNGCNKCGIKLKSDKLRHNNDIFISKAIVIHGDKYNYTKIDYKNAQTKVCIICPIHGEFWQTPSDHLQGRGCSMCGNVNRSLSKTNNTEYFIKKSNKKHNFKYDYSKTNYVNSESDVCIVCPEHGEFYQKANSHMIGYGCSKCGGNFMDLDTFIEKSKEKHNNKFTYENVDYINSIIKVDITCPIHGEFWQTPNSHLDGKGCPKCSGSYMDYNYFIEKTKLIHRDKYDYSKVEYKGTNIKVKIICPIHGEFWQTPHNHLKGQGCPKCNESKGEKIVNQTLTNFKLKFIREHKFDDCRYKYSLPFDFYIPKYNTCIEYDGEQHYKQVDRFGGIEGFESIQRNDKIKTQYCLDNNIKLIRIPYTEFNNIEEILNKEIYD